MRYTIGYKEEPNKVIPLYVKTSEKLLFEWCQPDTMIIQHWKMGFNVSEDPSMG